MVLETVNFLCLRRGSGLDHTSAIPSFLLIIFRNPAQNTTLKKSGALLDV